MNLATVVAISAATSTGLVGFFAFVFREAIKARLKRSVDAYVEKLKHDLQREALKAELSTKQKHVIYPQIAAKLRRAEAALDDLVGADDPDWNEMDEAELTAHMVRMRIPGRHRESLVQHFRGDRAVAFQEMQLAARMARFNAAKRLAESARKYVILNSLYLSPGLRESAQSVAGRMYVAAFEQEIVNDAKTLHDTVEQVRRTLGELEAGMQAELHPRERV